MWNWDDSLALNQPTQYRKTLERFVRTVLAPGDGVDGLVFEQFPVLGPVTGLVSPAQATAETQQRDAGVNAWNAIASSMPGVFPGKVMYFPVGPAVELDGRFTAWLPPSGEPRAPSANWVRVRMQDTVHFCPAGAARYANALLADLTSLVRLPAPAAGWSTGTWTNDARFRVGNVFSNPCPDDHPSS
jgi:lysophospholipase L1-like esterase